MTGTIRRPIFGTLLVAAIALAGCGGVAGTEIDPITGSAVLNATESAKTAKFEMTMTHAAPHAFMEWTARGAVDFAGERGTAEIAMSTEYSPPPTSAGQQDLENRGEVWPTGEMSVDARWIGDDAWIGMRAGENPKDGEYWGLPPAGKWMHTDTTDDEFFDCTVSGGAGFGTNGPPTAAARDILETLRTNGDRLEQLGTEVVRDEPTTHWRVATPTLSPKCTAEDKNALEKVVIEVWTDDGERARRILLSVEGTSFGGDEERASFSTDFYDFGTPVEVTPPPKSAIVEIDEIESFSGEGGHTITEEVTDVDYGTPGEWTVAASGERTGKPWRVWVAKTSTGMDCYDIENVSDRPTTVPGAPDGQVMHDGRLAICDGGPLGTVLSIAGFFGLADITDGAQRSIVGTVGGDSADLVFADGTTQPMQIDPKTNLAQWSGAPPAGAIKVESRDVMCSLDPPTDENARPAADIENGNGPCMGIHIGP